MKIDEAIRSRISIRGFLSGKEVPRDALNEALELAQRAPSNCNVQPWRVFIASGQRCQALRERLCDAFDRETLSEPEDPIDEFAGIYMKRQYECAVQLYGAMGVARNDRAGRIAAERRNYEFFGAPHIAIICQLREFGIGVALDVGGYLQTLMLALRARGIGSCPQAALRKGHEIIKNELQISDDLRILCGLSFGYPDESVPANAARQDRQPLAANVTFLDS